VSTTLDVPASAARQRGAIQRARLIRSALICILGPTILYGLYLLLIAPAQYHASASFAVRGAQAAGGGGALAALGMLSPSSNAADAMVVETFMKSDAMVKGLRDNYGFDKAYDRFSLDPTARMPASASLRKATRFWRHKIDIEVNQLTAGATVRVSAYSAEDALRLSRGVLQLSENLMNSMPERALDDLVRESNRNVEEKRRLFEQARDALANYQGSQYSGVLAQTPAQQAASLAGSIESQLVARRTALATLRETYQPNAPQVVGLEREIAALEREQQRAIAAGRQAPGERAAASDIEAQTLLINFETAQATYQQAIQAVDGVRRQQVVDRKYIVSYVPPTMPAGSDWVSRLSSLVAVFLGAALLWGVAALIYSIVRDHVE
jgi:capsular polysaccharide transport system permease protein